ncbi:MAG TPA: rhomboid family intramembrane serine protease [Stellaceae bacterium]|nr:rhomboid family intramembrane serine protease [Stellaceae bacterium]
MSAQEAPRQRMFNVPTVTKWLLVANVAIFAVTATLPDATSDAIVGVLGFSSARYHGGFHLAALFDPITYQFLHGGIEHIAVNMLGLVAFGAGVEQRLGPWRFLAFYLVCGVIGAFAELAIDPHSTDLMIGASASISGLFGAILRFGAFRRTFWTLVAAWLVLNAVTGIAGVGSEGVPVAWVAHVGGFLAGLVLYPLLVRPAYAGK